MNVLLVTGDDEILATVRGLVRDLGHTCTTVMALRSAARVLELSRYDVAILGADAAGSGLATLTAAAPSTVRVVLSDDPTRLGRAVATAHHLLSPHCTRAELATVMSRAREVREALATDAILDLIGEIGGLSVVPDLWTRLGALAADPNVSFDDVADAVGTDPGLAAKLVGLANSPVFGFRHRVVELSDAVRLVGLDLVVHLAMTAGVLQVFDGRPLPTGIMMREIADHGVACCAVVNDLALDPESRGVARTASLIANIGQLVMGVALPDRYATVVGFARAGAHPLHSLERELFGFSHAEVGALLLRYWGLPRRIVDAVALHHAPTPDDDPAARAVQLAHLIVQAGDEVGQDPVAVRGRALLVRYAASAGLEVIELPTWEGAATG